MIRLLLERLAFAGFWFLYVLFFTFVFVDAVVLGG